MKDAFNSSAAGFAALRSGLDALGLPYVMAANGACVIEGEMRHATVKKLAQSMGGTGNFVSFDLAHLNGGQHGLNRLLGTPPGYVGFTEAEKTIVDEIRQTSPSLLLFSQFDRADAALRSFVEKAITANAITDHAGKAVSLSGTPVLLLVTKLPADLQWELDEQAFRRTCALSAPLRVLRPIQVRKH